MGGPPEPNNDHMEGARRDCKSRDAPPPEEKAAKRRQDLARQELARNVASLPPPEGAGQMTAPTQLDLDVEDATPVLDASMASQSVLNLAQ